MVSIISDQNLINKPLTCVRTLFVNSVIYKDMWLRFDLTDKLIILFSYLTIFKRLQILASTRLFRYHIFVFHGNKGKGKALSHAEELTARTELTTHPSATN